MGSFESNNNSRALMLTILDKDSLPANQVALAKAKKWVASIFNIFDDEIDNELYLHNDLGEVAYQLDPSAETGVKYSLQQVLRLLEMNCGKFNSNEYSMVNEALSNMSANERRWFIRYWMRKPRNGIDRGIVTKSIASYYKKKQAVVKNHLNFNSVSIVSEYYEGGMVPPNKSKSRWLCKTYVSKRYSYEEVADK